MWLRVLQLVEMLVHGEHDPRSASLGIGCRGLADDYHRGKSEGRKGGHHVGGELSFPIEIIVIAFLERVRHSSAVGQEFAAFGDQEKWPGNIAPIRPDLV